MYRKLEWALLKTGAEVPLLPKGAMPWLLHLKPYLWPVLSQMEKHSNLRHVHGFPLIWVRQTLSYWETHCFSPWIIAIQRPVHLSSGGMALMGCGWEAALCTLCIGSRNTFHEVQINIFLWTYMQQHFPTRDNLLYTLSVEVSNYTDYTDFSFAWFPTAWSTHLH